MKRLICWILGHPIFEMVADGGTCIHCGAFVGSSSADTSICAKLGINRDPYWKYRWNPSRFDLFKMAIYGLVIFDKGANAVRISSRRTRAAMVFCVISDPNLAFHGLIYLHLWEVQHGRLKTEAGNADTILNQEQHR